MKYAAIVLMFGLLACDSKKSANVADGPPPNPGSVAVALPSYTPCVANQTATTNKCKNMLPSGWRTYSTPQNKENLLRFLRELTPTTGQPNPIPDPKQRVTATRRTAAECNEDASGGKKTVPVTYTRAVQMDNFPSAGTNSQDLVVAIMVANNSIDCEEFRYGPIVNIGGRTRELQFVTVQTQRSDPASGTLGDDRVIGEWQSWAVERINGDLKFREIRRGAYVLCGVVHPPAQYGELSFLNCKDATTLHKEAEATAGAAAEGAVAIQFSRLIALYNMRDPKVLGRLTDTPLEAPAWGRCGNLGCCAMY